MTDAERNLMIGQADALRCLLRWAHSLYADPMLAEQDMRLCNLIRVTELQTEGYGALQPASPADPAETGPRPRDVSSLLPTPAGDPPGDFQEGPPPARAPCALVSPRYAHQTCSTCAMLRTAKVEFPRGFVPNRLTFSAHACVLHNALVGPEPAIVGCREWLRRP